MAHKIPKAIRTGKLHFGDLVIPCAVLEDGRRVLSERGTSRALGRSRGGSDYRRRVGSEGGGKLPVFIGASNLNRFIPSDLRVALSSPILFRPPQTGKTAYGIEATALPVICDVFLKAREAGVLTAGQQPIAERASTLMRGFAHVGIIALVDEATGYQEDRDRDALQKILEAYIAPELLPWTKVFPNDFYRELFRLKNWQYSPMSVKRPQYVGKLTNELIYDKLPQGVLDELKSKNPVIPKTKRRRHKHFQFLTEEVGNPHLKNQLVAVITLMRASAGWKQFKRSFARAFPPPEGFQEELFEEDE
jgi:hypothetical protein